MSKKKMFLISLVALVFFLILVKPWGKDYYFPVSTVIVYFLSSFIKSGIIKYYLLIGILALLVIFLDSWLIDHITPFFLILIIFGDVLYQVINLIQAKIFKKFEYKMVKVLIPVFPILVTLMLLYKEKNDLHEIKSNLPLVYSKLLKSCEITGECPEKIWRKEKITKGITTIQISYSFKNNCLQANPSKNWVKMKHYDSCKKKVVKLLDL